MKWSEIQCQNRVYGAFDENERAVKGAFLCSLGINLEKMSEELFEPCESYDATGKVFSEEREEKVYIWNVIGTKHSCYGGKTWIQAFVEEHKSVSHILHGRVTRGKYFRMLKKHIDDVDIPCISLIKDKSGNYYVDRNGNHRVTFYKLMYLADLANGNQNLHSYWFYANVRDEI